MHRAIFKAYFAEGKNIGKADELVAIAERLGLSGESARKVLVSRAYQYAIEDDWARARQMGITAVPTFVAGRGRLTGAQPYEVMVKFLGDNLEQI